MVIRRIDMTVLKRTATRPRIAVWCTALVFCLFFSVLTLQQANEITHEYQMEPFFSFGEYAYELLPGQTLEQCYTAQGKSAGAFSYFQIQAFREPDSEGNAVIRLYNDSTGEIELETATVFSEISQSADFYGELQRKQNGEKKLLPNWYDVVDDSWYYRIRSGQKYRLEIINQSDTDILYLLGNDTVQSGKLTIDGEKQIGFLNMSGYRQSVYQPSRLLLLMVLLTDFTVLFGLGLVLFTDVKTEILYLILAAGFGLVMLFDLTPIYGFDMRFQFDSTYVVSNHMLGLEGAIMAPSQTNPETQVLSYYRRICDDHSQYQFKRYDEVSANYTDMKAALRTPFVEEEDTELILVETDLGFVSEPLFMYIPQAIGFTIARLLGLGMYPMLQAGRLVSYAMFVLCMVLAIRAIPFGKRLMMVLGLMPAVLVQEISLSRDAMIISISFLLIALVLKMHYEEKKPGWYQWLPVLILSVLLAPCKMVYLPVSCLCMMVVYKHHILPAGKNGRRFVVFAMALFVIAMGIFIITNSVMIKSILYGDSISLYNTPAYSLGIMLENPLHTLYVFGNTLRNQLGNLLINAVQLFAIDLGFSEGITLIVFALLLLESFCVDSECRVHVVERGYMLLVATSTFLLLVLAAFRWTPVEMDVFIGLQGRYLIPILPLVLLAWYNNRIIQINVEAAIITKIGCCIFPAISLMNMYLWTIAQ